MDTHIPRTSVKERRIFRVLPAVTWGGVLRHNDTPRIGNEGVA